MALRDLLAVVDVKSTPQTENPQAVVQAPRRQFHAHSILRTFNGTTDPTRWTENVQCPFQARFVTIKRLGYTGDVSSGNARLLTGNLVPKFAIPFIEGQAINDPNITYEVDNMRTTYDFTIESSAGTQCAANAIAAGQLTVLLYFESNI